MASGAVLKLLRVDECGREPPNPLDIPETVDAASVASACQEIWQWAEMNNLRETALQFAEAAAHVGTVYL